ncbi:PREDICTED: uncharacterized protein LOC105558385 [Vollenhovia emeryi]|uniref:uncharacterized protein LOC105558385 n=1 Tax=Vollenhovia emeryi TaxID=411798 RepID=UPI0005F4EE74|nr:PREDICTED: uncharacterized protein LOC105558385 [Vollenhovia emeryi]XP_011861413.1 PREDICTED: uncharacterized protein LOC105558385 [Vollenhovia emeryi]XP_011861414.1 PREDICTED: uncharacterized protein LOC105558385 [Vollenhovia emeryi]
MTDDTSSESILERLFDYVQLGLEWSSEKLESACPSKKRKTRKKCKLGQSDEDTDIGPPCTEQRPYYTLPSQICPKAASCCYIKMQDPYAPCCCEPKSQPLPCPPKCRRQQREPTCGCDLCKKSADSKCCDPIMAFRSAASNSKCFEKA